MGRGRKSEWLTGRRGKRGCQNLAQPFCPRHKNDGVGAADDATLRDDPNHRSNFLSLFDQGSGPFFHLRLVTRVPALEVLHLHLLRALSATPFAPGVQAYGPSANHNLASLEIFYNFI